MAGFIRAVALDLDATIAEGDFVSQAALAEVDRIRDEGLVAVLATGRILAELDSMFPGLREHFDAVVAENGAVLAVGDSVRDLGEPVEDALTDALEEEGVPFRRGRVLLAGDVADAQAVLSAVGALGLDCQIVRNRGALMVLPAGVSKGTGLEAALAELGVSAHNSLAIGDAENDLALLHAAEVGVAVANAVPSLRDHADLTLGAPDGAGVAALLSGPVLTGQQVIQPARRRLTIGHFEDGTEAAVPAWPANILICGQTSAGKSYIAGLLIEEWIVAGYTILVVDMEGDHAAMGQLRNTVVLDSQTSAGELLSMLRQHSLSVVVDVSELSPARRLDYLRTLPEVIEGERAAWGLPHWIVVDEAHLTHSSEGIAANVFRPTDRGYCLVTYHPEQLTPEALGMIDVTITADAPAAVALNGTVRGAPTARLRTAGGVERSFVVGARRTPHVRHRHKYAVAPLPEWRWFRFRGPDGQTVATARGLADFTRIVKELDGEVLAHHLKRGDFSRWILGTIQDRELAATVGTIERSILARRAADLLHARERLIEEVELRYLTSSP